MSVKGKISIRKVLQVALTVVVSAGCVVAMIAASRVEDKQTVKSVAVHIKNAKKYHFVDQREIMDKAIYDRHVDIIHTPVSRLDINGMEQVVKADPWVADAQVYVDNDRVLHMYVTQRVPVARLFTQDGNSCYIDKDLNIMPLSPTYTYYTSVVTNVPALHNDSTDLALRRDIVTLVRTISADSFWSAQVSEVGIDSAGAFELMPVLGDHRILLGEVKDVRNKLDNLLAFYKNVLNRIGWDKYEVLDLRFHNQVVASPSLPYKGPVDKAVASMNWITSIEATEAEKRSRDSLDKAMKAAPPPALPLKPTVLKPRTPAAAPKEPVKVAAKPLAAKPKVKAKAKVVKPAPAKKIVKPAAKKVKAQPAKKDNKQKKQPTGKPKYEYGAPKKK